MTTIRVIETVRICKRPDCNKPLVRRKGEAATSWEIRKYCSGECVRIHRQAPDRAPTNCQLPTCPNQLIRRQGETRSSFLNRKYCSPGCANKANGALTKTGPKVCLYPGCDNELVRGRESERAYRDRKFCSITCGSLHRVHIRGQLLPNTRTSKNRRGLETPNLPNAACAGLMNDTFFPAIHEPITRQKQICDTCPLATRQACLQWAIENREIGIWAGTTDEDRQQIRRRLSRQRSAA